MRNNIKNAFATRWPIYLIWAIASIILWTWIIHAINDPSSEEIFWLFLSGYNINSEAIGNEIKTYESYPKNIRRFYVKGFSLDNASFDTYLNTYGLVHSDLLILPKGKLDALGSYGSLCSSFDETLKTKLFSNIPNEILEQNGKYYGFKIYDKDTHTGVYQNYITYVNTGVTEQDYYLVFKTTSVHLGEMETNTKTDYAISIAKDIMLHG